MTDLIDRQAAINAVNCGALSAAMVYGRTDEGSAALYETIKAIKALPSEQPEPRWIPCSERLPDEYEYVLLCDIEPDEDTGYSRMAVGWLEDGKICCWDDRATREEFVAWMPLPEPYKGDNNG